MDVNKHEQHSGQCCIVTEV